MMHNTEGRERDSDYETVSKVAQLVPNAPSNTQSFCYACQEPRKVRRTKCTNCPGNCYRDHDEECLTCGAAHESEWADVAVIPSHFT